MKRNYFCANDYSLSNEECSKVALFPEGKPISDYKRGRQLIRRITRRLGSEVIFKN